MADVKGKMVFCERCGQSVFVKLTGKDYFDGGFSSRDTFEQLPEGWKESVCIEHYVTLCPNCYDEWQKVKERFFGKGADVREPQK